LTVDSVIGSQWVEVATVMAVGEGRLEEGKGYYYYEDVVHITKSG
jgi:hypothetical protein